MSTRHALIIDDNLNNLEVLEELLTEQNFSYTAIQDPTRVSDELQSLAQVDVVFCDLEMPKLDGFQILSILREQLGQSVPIITYTVHLSEIDKSRRMGFDGFLGKPLDAERFPVLISRILAGEAVWELP